MMKSPEQKKYPSMRTSLRIDRSQYRSLLQVRELRRPKWCDRQISLRDALLQCRGSHALPRSRGALHNAPYPTAERQVSNPTLREAYSDFMCRTMTLAKS